MKNLMQLGRILNKAEQKQVKGGLADLTRCEDYDLSLCGCGCTGNITGPKYCQWCMGGCPQEIIC